MILVYVVLAILTALVAVRLVAPSLYRKIKYGVKMVIIMIMSVWAGTSTWMFALRQERKSGKANPKKVMEHCSGCFKPIFRFLKLTFDIDIPPSIDMDASYVVILNHPRVVMKAELRGLGPIGKAFEKMNSVFLKRGTKALAMASLIEATKQSKEDGDRIVLFPEGTRHMGDTLLPFKLGAFQAAISAGIPLLPVVVGSYKKLPQDWQVDLSVESTIKVRVLQPVSTEGLVTEGDDVTELAEKCRNIMLETFAEM